MDPAVTEALAACLRAITTDEPWQDFGFAKRPRYGAWVQRLRPKWRVELEKTVLQQMLSALTAAYILAGKIPRGSIDASVALYTSDIAVVSALGFESPEEGARSLKISIQEYVSSPSKDWHQILYQHIRPDLVPDEKLRPCLILGCAQFGMTAANMIAVLQYQDQDK